jgi:hypothetical protein
MILKLTRRKKNVGKPYKKTENYTKINMESKICGRGHNGKKRQECKRLHIKIMEKKEGPQKKRKIKDIY